MLRHNFPQFNTKIFYDCSNLDNVELPKVDLLSAGSPCQHFSPCGNGKGKEDERGLSGLHAAKVINRLEPKLFLLENVGGLYKKHRAPLMHSQRTIMCQHGDDILCLFQK